MEESRVTIVQSLTWSTEPYCYSPLLPTEIRLLRITPGRVDTPLFLSLKIIPLDKVHAKVLEFQALSYAWGKNTFEYDVQLSDLPRAGETSNQAGSRVEKKNSPKFRAFSIRQNLCNALQRIRLIDNYSWIWADAICIDQSNNIEKNQQIPKVPDIYSSAYNVIAWLGEGGSGSDDVGKAIDLIPHILNLKTLDLMLRGQLLN
ncbi:heterokaryon incompatibility protein-domain-containing protein [Paraphoma chrysanthemicola]|uniref:Heterokaryon incompatibility protein-domain-containing protein n=1 Tax=Paraphoma chrysanthemicola TaxID=798071 RepID=A0A8K0R253_9PLEO|nr:heterokaryon incompatibility protein-domain-containing protein [Paraphoma chrysanthemicola]